MKKYLDYRKAELHRMIAETFLRVLVYDENSSVKRKAAAESVARPTIREDEKN